MRENARRRRDAARGDDLRGHDPQALYDELERLAGGHVDSCVLSVLRQAVCYAGTATPEKDLTLWWNWKDGGLADRRRPAGPSDA